MSDKTAPMREGEDHKTLMQRLQEVAFFATAFDLDAGRVDLATVVDRLRRNAHKARPPFDDMRRQLADDLEARRV